MGYQFFQPKISQSITQKIVFVEVGDGSENSGSFFMYCPEISIDPDGTSTITCWTWADGTALSGRKKKSFEIKLEEVESLIVRNERTVFDATISELLLTELVYGPDHEWFSPSVGDKVKVYIEKPFDSSLTNIGLIIGAGDRDEIEELREKANSF